MPSQTHCSLAPNSRNNGFTDAPCNRLGGCEFREKKVDEAILDRNSPLVRASLEIVYQVSMRGILQVVFCRELGFLSLETLSHFRQNTSMTFTMTSRATLTGLQDQRPGPWSLRNFKVDSPSLSGATWPSSEDETTPLQLAAWGGHVEERLVANWTLVDMKGKFGSVYIQRFMAGHMGIVTPPLPLTSL